MRRGWLVLAVGLGLSWSAAGDVVQLQDGTRVEGTMRREPGGWTITDAAGRAVFVSDDRVRSIEKKSSLSKADLAASRLAALRRSVEALEDLEAIIKRYEELAAQSQGTPAGEEAARELAVWKERREQKLVKAGAKWVTVEERAALLERAEGMIENVRGLIGQGRLRDAEGALAELLALNPNHPSALYLRGVLAYRQDRLAEARQAFDRVRELAPNHAPTLNNIGVILWRQKQQLGALALYDMAMQAGPRHRQVLDNVAEALQTLTDAQKEATSPRNASRRFAVEDAALQKELGEQGLFRWGATYATREKLEEIRQAQERNQQRLDALADDYERVRARIGMIESQIEANDRSLRRIDGDRTYVDRDGRVIQLRRPSIWYEIRRENDLLEAEQAQLRMKLTELRDRARLVQQDTPVPAYTGVQRIIDVEGMPEVGPVQGPATQPGKP